MEIIWEELISGLPDAGQVARVIIRLTAAMLVGALVGAQRERTGKPAGLRTHMLVAWARRSLLSFRRKSA
jgi:putative Mg2+ transporter-C (MgtC) family protein